MSGRDRTVISPLESEDRGEESCRSKDDNRAAGDAAWGEGEEGVGPTGTTLCRG